MKWMVESRLAMAMVALFLLNSCGSAAVVAAAFKGNKNDHTTPPTQENKQSDIQEQALDQPGVVLKNLEEVRIALQGKWQPKDTCLRHGDGSYRFTMEFASGEYKRYDEVYSNDDCAGGVLEQRAQFEGPFQILELDEPAYSESDSYQEAALEGVFVVSFGEGNSHYNSKVIQIEDGLLYLGNHYKSWKYHYIKKDFPWQKVR